MISNEKLKKSLSQRDVHFKSIEDAEISDMDDSGLEKYFEFKKKYDLLTPLEKDLWYLDTQYKRIEIAAMYNVSRSYITQLLQEIHKKL